MNKKKLEYFKELLLSERRDILEEMGLLQENSLGNTSKEASGSDATYSSHMADQGTDAQEREIAFYIATRDHKHLKRLDEALSRIEDGTYGICISCGKEIPLKRLEAVPITQRCVPCKTKEGEQ